MQQSRGKRVVGRGATLGEGSIPPRALAGWSGEWAHKQGYVRGAVHSVPTYFEHEIHTEWGDCAEFGTV
jgi:hypothetical protein